MVRIVYPLLGFCLIIYTTSAPSLQEILILETTTLIRKLAEKHPGKFELVLLDLDPGRHLFDGWLGDIVSAPRLETVARYVVNSTFELTYKNLPRKPGLIVVHVGNRYLNRPTRFETMFFLNMNCNSRLLVLVDASNRERVNSAKMYLMSLQFDKVVYMGTKQPFVFTVGFGGNIIDAAQRLSEMPDLFRSNIRNSRGRSIHVTFQNTPFPAIARWVQETARFLNTVALFVRGVCTSDMSFETCISRVSSAFHIDISLDRMGSDGYSGLWHHALFDFEPIWQVILTPQSRQFNAVEVFTKPFTIETWIVLMLILLLIELINLIFPTCFKNDPILLLVCGLERYDLHLTSAREKITLLPLMVFFFLMCNAYETKIISFMINKPSIDQIRTLQQLKDSGIKIKANLRGQPMLVNESTIGSLFVQQEDYRSMDGVNAYLVTSMDASTELSLLSNYDFKLHRPKYVMINENIFPSISMFPMGPISPLMEMFAFTQKVFFESGLYKKWQEDANEAEIRWARADYQSIYFDDLGLLTFEDLESTWGVLAIGLCISLVVFVFELLLKYCGKRFLRSSASTKKNAWD